MGANPTGSVANGREGELAKLRSRRSMWLAVERLLTDALMSDPGCISMASPAEPLK